MPENVWKLYVRARAIDKAANEGSTVWDKAVIIDLDRPEATIERIERTGGGGFGDATTPAEKKPIPPVGPGSPATKPGGSGTMAIPELPGFPGTGK